MLVNEAVGLFSQATERGDGAVHKVVLAHSHGNHGCSADGWQNVLPLAVWLSHIENHSAGTWLTESPCEGTNARGQSRKWRLDLWLNFIIKLPARAPSVSTPQHFTAGAPLRPLGAEHWSRSSRLTQSLAMTRATRRSLIRATVCVASLSPLSIALHNYSLAIPVKSSPSIPRPLAHTLFLTGCCC